MASLVYSYTTEMFPTLSRTTVAGICSTSGRIGSILAPIIANMVASDTKISISRACNNFQSFSNRLGERHRSICTFHHICHHRHDSWSNVSRATRNQKHAITSKHSTGKRLGKVYFFEMIRHSVSGYAQYHLRSHFLCRNTISCLRCFRP